MNFNDDEIVGLLNRLLEMLHQTDGNNQGSIVFNVYSSGSLHVDHVDTQNFYGDACPKTAERERERKRERRHTRPTRFVMHRTGDGAVAKSAAGRLRR